MFYGYLSDYLSGTQLNLFARVTALSSILLLSACSATPLTLSFTLNALFIIPARPSATSSLLSPFLDPSNTGSKKSDFLVFRFFAQK